MLWSYVCLMMVKKKKMNHFNKTTENFPHWPTAFKSFLNVANNTASFMGISHGYECSLTHFKADLQISSQNSSHVGEEQIHIPFPKSISVPQCQINTEVKLPFF